MAESGNFDLTKVQAKYKVDDVILVDVNKLHSANESRLYFEFGFAIGIPLSVLFSEKLLDEHKFDTTLFVCALAFMLFGIVMLVRYVMKHRKLIQSETNITQSVIANAKVYKKLKKYLKKNTENKVTYYDSLYNLVKEHQTDKFPSAKISATLVQEFKLKTLCIVDESSNCSFTNSAIEFINWCDLS